MKFWLSELGLFSVIYSVKAKEKEKTTSSKETIETKEDVSDIDILCHGRILSALHNNVYKIFCHTKASIELLEAFSNSQG
ncbi:MAG: hypothetical protein Q8877_03130 [Sweet potato little leaf phytoplasma]|nr:hypothetical protein [Sweet potato little leaf phytoplasma]